jgi:hypothetical protein
MASASGISSKPLTSANCLVTLTRYIEAKDQYNYVINQANEIREKYKYIDRIVATRCDDTVHLAEARRKKLCKRAGLPYPMPIIDTSYVIIPHGYTIAILYERILEQFKKSNVAKIERSIITNNDSDSVSISAIFTHSHELVLLLKGLGFKCHINITKEPIYCDSKSWNKLTSILTVSIE